MESIGNGKLYTPFLHEGNILVAIPQKKCKKNCYFHTENPGGCVIRCTGYSEYGKSVAFIQLEIDAQLRLILQNITMESLDKTQKEKLSKTEVTESGGIAFNPFVNSKCEWVMNMGGDIRDHPEFGQAITGGHGIHCQEEIAREFTDGAFYRCTLGEGGQHVCMYDKQLDKFVEFRHHEHFEREGFSEIERIGV